MTRTTFLHCCITLAIGTVAAFAVAQSNSNPFGTPPTQIPFSAPPDYNPFGPAAATSAPVPAASSQPAYMQEAPPQLATLPVESAPVEEGNFCKCLGESGEAAAKIKTALAGTIRSNGLEYNAIALEQVVADISHDYGVPVQIDRSALEDAGMGPDEPVTINLHRITLKSALLHLLRQHTLTYIIQDEVLLITTPTVAEEQLKVCIYDIRDLVGQLNADGPDNLIDTIISCIAPETWAESGGGTAQIRAVQPGLVAISQTQAVHEEIRALIQVIREMNKQPKPAAAALPAASAPVVTRYYVLRISTPVGQEAQDALSKRLRELISAVVPDQKWSGTLADGQPVLLSVWPDRVVVRHQESVQRQVEAALVDSGMIIARQRNARGSTKANPNSGNFQGGGGGGFFQPQRERE